MEETPPADPLKERLLPRFQGIVHERILQLRAVRAMRRRSVTSLMSKEGERPTFELQEELFHADEFVEVSDEDARRLTWFRRLVHKIRLRAPYYMPVLRWLPQYNLEKLRSDFVAAITVATMIIPQGLSYATMANLPSKYGLYTAFVPVLVYVFMGTSRQLSVGPEAVVALLVGSVVTTDLDLETRVTYATVMALLLGILTLFLGILRLGFFDNIFSRALMEGFVLASAFLIMTEQLRPLLGISGSLEGNPSTLKRLQSVLSHLDEVDGLTCAFGLPSLAVLILLDLLRKRFPASSFLRFFPGILFVVVTATIVSYMTKADVAILGASAGGFYTPSAPPIASTPAQSLLSSGAVIFVVGFVEASATAKRYSSKHNYAVSANRELVALGLANIIGSFFGSYPVFASLPRTNIADAAGARTQMVGLFVFGFVLVAIAALVPYFHYLPRAVTAAIVFKAGLALAHFDQVKFIIRVRAWKDGGLLLITFILTLAVGVATGVFAGLAISVGMIIKESTLPHLTILGDRGGETEYDDEFEATPTKRGGAIIIRFDGPLNFANTGQLRDLLRRVEMLGNLNIHPSLAPDLPPPIQAVVFDLTGTYYVDPSAGQILTEIAQDYKSRGVRFCVVGLIDKVRSLLTRCGLFEQVAASNVFETMDAANHSLDIPPDDDHPTSPPPASPLSFTSPPTHRLYQSQSPNAAQSPNAQSPQQMQSPPFMQSPQYQYRPGPRPGPALSPPSIQEE
eukprot:m.152168 g.152168  ORF g.152168 m.152168 type:complete len:739 (-) comp16914_c0_seq1:263-2479(-)